MTKALKAQHSSQLMALPNEIILHILKPLRKPELKSARLVSKTWAAFAAELLFDQAYISVHPENLEVFRAITQHPLLSKCVKTLRYDAVNVVNCEEEQYFEHLWQQTRYDHSTSSAESSEAPISDPEIQSWIDLVANNDLHSSKATTHYDFVRRKCKGYRFIQCGYRKFQRYAALQRVLSNNEDFFETLVSGLQRLRNLVCVTMDDHWPSPPRVLDASGKLFLKSPSGSPMARNWEVLHVRPLGWELKPQIFRLNRSGLGLASDATDGADHYWAIVGALIRSQRKIENFELCHGFSHGIPPHVFDKSAVEGLSFYGLDMVAFSGLKYLKLHIAAYCNGWATSIWLRNIDGLRALLGSMHNLEALDLDLPEDRKFNPTLYNHNQVFPQDGRWTQLKSLRLHNLASSAADFLTLLTRQMPNLNKLELGVTELLTGTWEGVIECMMQSMHLTSLDIWPETQLWHHGSTEFLHTWDSPDVSKIDAYVEDGGRHPCLRYGQPDSAARHYITEDLEPFYQALPLTEKICG